MHAAVIYNGRSERRDSAECPGRSHGRIPVDAVEERILYFPHHRIVARILEQSAEHGVIIQGPVTSLEAGEIRLHGCAELGVGSRAIGLDQKEEVAAR